MEPIRILIADDDAGMRTVMRKLVERVEGYALAGEASDGEELLALYDSERPDVVLMDVEMPKIDGVECAKIIQDRNPRTVLVFATAHEQYMRSAFEVYAFDYLVKPFSPRELVARARALLRRVHADSEPQREVLEFGELTIDVSGHKVMVSGKEIDLTASEFKLLTTLLGYDFEGYERTIDSHVKNLRAKIGDNPRNPKWLHTVHGVGYRFEDPTKQGQ